MGGTSCWLVYDADRILSKKDAQGWFGKSYTDAHPATFPPLDEYKTWPELLRSWGEARGLNLRKVNGAGVEAKVTKDEIFDFIQYVYGGAESYVDPAKMLTWNGDAYLVHRLVNLRAFVAKHLDTGVQYAIRAANS